MGSWLLVEYESLSGAKLLNQLKANVPCFGGFSQFEYDKAKMPELLAKVRVEGHST